ncbi:hypothetical protein DES53_106175 [Roseimicrobium gellanilyticum]|uniref:Uncharacterized protein n=1 Tax=Roseimicrobium gellanilyticum TaxID=748857 RepID=A0A366HI79_9BACT|nr:hypothetical protein [Roseimicrobium gellanilyticum]RBP42467.1 hypothetical protein DES53_106175 [Roseimicrobium gellanilyticum]
MIQGTEIIGPCWDRLPDEKRDLLIRMWQHFIQQDPMSAAENIMNTLSSHPDLQDAWNVLSPSIQQVRGNAMRVIAVGTITRQL